MATSLLFGTRVLDVPVLPLPQFWGAKLGVLRGFCVYFALFFVKKWQHAKNRGTKQKDPCRVGAVASKKLVLGFPSVARQGHKTTCETLLQNLHDFLYFFGSLKKMHFSEVLKKCIFSPATPSAAPH